MPSPPQWRGDVLFPTLEQVTVMTRSRVPQGAGVRSHQLLLVKLHPAQQGRCAVRREIAQAVRHVGPFFAGSSVDAYDVSPSGWATIVARATASADIRAADSPAPPRRRT
jgi:hypothetical protein